MIIKHIVELETVILDNANLPEVEIIKSMSEQERQRFDADKQSDEVVANGELNVAAVKVPAKAKGGVVKAFQGPNADKEAYIIFEKNVVIPLREMVTEIFQELLNISRLKADFTIKNFQIINETIVEVEGDASKTQDALNAMSPLVATKVLNTMTTNEVRALASLPPIEGGDVVPSQQPAAI